MSDGSPAHYPRFRVGERVLLTGHSHQAWPDVDFAAPQQAWLDAADLLDDKWALNVVPFDVAGMSLHEAFITGAGYSAAYSARETAFCAPCVSDAQLAEGIAALNDVLRARP